jgi:hypothetical protein
MNGGVACPTNLSRSATCPAPVDCVVQWTCSSCDYTGNQVCTGTISKPAANGGVACPASLTKTQGCTLTRPTCVGCYSDQDAGGKSGLTPSNMGIKSVQQCNELAKTTRIVNGVTINALNKPIPYFGMSYWQGAGYNSQGLNKGLANCVLPNQGTDDTDSKVFNRVTSYTQAPGGSGNNANKCLPDPESTTTTYTHTCIEADTINACAVNTDASAPPGKLGGGWINAIYKTV